MISGSVSLSQLLEFEALFPDETPLSIEEYLQGGSKDIILKSATHFLGFKPYASSYDDNGILLSALFGPENQNFANHIYRRINEIKQKNGKEILIVNPYSSLKLFESFFHAIDPQETQSPKEFEVNLFKAYLVLNSEFTKVQQQAGISTKDLDPNLKLPMLFFCMYYPVADKSNYDIGQVVATQFIKTYYLFNFLESNSSTIILLSKFLQHFNCDSWQTYLKRLIPLAISGAKGKEAHVDIIIPKNEDYVASCEFLDKQVVVDTDALEEFDFLTIRTKPFYKIKDGVYRIIFNLFVAEKVFKGIYFLLRDINSTLPQSVKILDIKGLYCLEFSEQTLLYKIMETIYPSGCIRFSGRDLQNISGAPDYYIRKGNDILLFESKDFLIRADKKYSFDYQVYDKEFRKTLYYEEQNGRIKNGAVKQLIGNIKKILKNEFTPDQNYRYKKIFIYPVLILHDHQYDTPGLSNLVNYWFQLELNQLREERYFIYHINPVVIVNIDSLIYHQAGLANKIQLIDVIKEYEQATKIIPGKKFRNEEEWSEYRLSKMIPFSLFIDRYFSKNNLIERPDIINTILPAVFE